MKRYIYELTNTGNDLLDGTMITQRANSRHEADAIVTGYAEKLHGKVKFIKAI
jgi:hypothetical protein